MLCQIYFNKASIKQGPLIYPGKLFTENLQAHQHLNGTSSKCESA